MLILNDLHMAVERSAGTTPASREALRSFMFAKLTEMMESSGETDLLVLGDLLDTFEIAPRDWVAVYVIFNEWLAKGHTLKLVAGNHDVSAKGNKLSSFAMLAHVLSEQYRDRVVVLDIGQSAMVDKGVMAIAHHANQELFDLTLTAALQSTEVYTTLLLHCNLDNHFAQQADHSLDLSAEMAEKFAARGVQILLAHEHNSRKVGNVTVLGNQIVTSIADCLESPVKWMHTLNDGELVAVETWRADGEKGYALIDWRELPVYEGNAAFIRVTGIASSNEAGDCISSIAKFRTKSNAFVITNSVKIEGVLDNEALPESFEATKAFDVMSFINSNLDERQQGAVKKLQGSEA